MSVGAAITLAARGTVLRDCEGAVTPMGDRKLPLSARARSGKKYQKAEKHEAKAPDARAARSKARAGRPKPSVAKKQAKAAAKGTRSSSRQPMPQGAPLTVTVPVEHLLAVGFELPPMQLPTRGASQMQRNLQKMGGMDLSEAVHWEIMGALEERV